MTPSLPGLDPEVSRRVEVLLLEPLEPVGILLSQVREHLKEVEQEAMRQDFIDVRLARTLASRLEELLNQVEDQPERHALVQAAARFFSDSNDLEPDLGSFTGFDDDAEVFNAVARALGREDLLINLD